jgi:hypothetical protein
MFTARDDSIDGEPQLARAYAAEKESGDAPCSVVWPSLFAESLPETILPRAGPKPFHRPTVASWLCCTSPTENEYFSASC